MTADKDLAIAVKDTIATAKESAQKRATETRDAAQDIGKATRQTTETASQALQAGASTTADTAQRTTGAAAEQFGRLSDEAVKAGRTMSERATRNMDAVMSAQSVMADGFQAVWKEWFAYTQGALDRWTQQTKSLTGARTLTDLVSAQQDLVRTEMEQLLKTSQRMSELASQITNDATRRITQRAEEHARETTPGA